MLAPEIKNGSIQMLLHLEEEKEFGPWIRTHNCDPAGRELADRHYSRQTIGAPRFTRPGTNLVLRTANGDAVWASWVGKYRRDNLKAYECTIFRNESTYLSSYLIAYACLATFETFGDIEDGIITYVDETKVKSNNPGFSFRSVGFKKIGRTKKSKLLIYQLKKEDLIRYLKTIDKNKEYIEYFNDFVNDAIYWAQKGEIYEAIDIFSKAMAVEKSLSEFYRFAKNKLKIHLVDKKDFSYVPCLEDFLIWVYGDWVPSEELEYWREKIEEKEEHIALN